MEQKVKATLRDVAKRAQVSIATASLILNEKSSDKFLPETVEIVLRCAQELGYEKRVKRVASESNNKTILVICPSVINPYYATIIQGIEQIARVEGYHTLLLTTYWDTDVEKYTLRDLQSRPPAGIIYCMPPQDLSYVEQINQTIPTVVIGDRSSETNMDMAEFNNYNGGILVARHLIKLGHKHIAYITTTLNPGHPARYRRLEGLRDTYQKECPNGKVIVLERHVDIAEERDNVDIEHQVGYSLTKQALSDKDITAFVAINDMVAYGVMDALEDGGYKVPQDYSVCGFDNLLFSRFSRIQLTTVEHSILQKGRSAFRLLKNQLEAKDHPHSYDTGSVTRVEYQSVLVEGKTTAPPRKK
ncbi:MAG: LacI family DNA-binding transcriptional regulator [Angelakisella sp.]|nr:LacI family DNA-binding transcriptional regulator [Angelakisella sp.]